MDDLSSVSGLVALGAGAAALIALLFTIVLGVKLRRIRRAQTVVLGEEGRDLVAHAARLESGFTELRDWVEESLSALDQRLGAGERRIDGCLAYRSVVRYDAYGEMSGHQSSSIALLDKHRSGVVISSIHHREQARVYVKPVIDGESEIGLSPEEQEALDRALSEEPGGASAPPQAARAS